MLCVWLQIVLCSLWLQYSSITSHMDDETKMKKKKTTIEIAQEMTGGLLNFLLTQ